MPGDLITSGERAASVRQVAHLVKRVRGVYARRAFEGYETQRRDTSTMRVAVAQTSGSAGEQGARTGGRRFPGRAQEVPRPPATGGVRGSAGGGWPGVVDWLGVVDRARRATGQREPHTRRRRARLRSRHLARHRVAPGFSRRCSVRSPFHARLRRRTLRRGPHARLRRDPVRRRRRAAPAGHRFAPDRRQRRCLCAKGPRPPRPPRFRSW